MEHRRLELLTPTLPVLCATSCANAPRTKNIIPQNLSFVKGENTINFIFYPDFLIQGVLVANFYLTFPHFYVRIIFAGKCASMPI